MSQATFSVRMDEVLKKQFDLLCQEFGMNMTTAINIFARTVVRERRIPFAIALDNNDVTRESGLQAFYALREQAEKNGVSGLSLEEINAEIAHVRRGENK